MRILYVINAFSWGGAERLTYELSLRMARKAEWVGIIALYRYGDDTEAEMIHSLRTHGVYTQILDKGVGKDRFRSIRGIAATARKYRVDVIHGHCSVPMFLGKCAGFLCRIPVVCTIHSIAGYSRKQEILTSRMVKKYVSIGADAENYMVRDLGISREKIQRIYNAADTEKIAAGQKIENFWLPYGGKPGDQVILTVARVTEAKNQLCQLRALEQCVKAGARRMKLYILGYYNENDPVYRTLSNYIREHDLSENVIFLGMHSDVADFLVNADCFVMTSFYEGLSVAFLEAVLAGCPVISTDVPFVHEMNGISACATVIPQDDSTGLARLLLARDYQPQTAETVKKFREQFSLEKFADLHYGLYETL